MNRYDDLSWGKLNLPSMQEMMLVPAMKRQQHEDLLNKQEAVRTGLAKVDPLDVHFEEAQRLKQGIESQMDTTATRLAKEGISPDMTNEAIRLNRQYQDLVSPTGRIGQINAAKLAEAQAKKEFFESPANKEYGLDALQRAWQSHRGRYTGYGAKGDVTNIGMLSSPKYIDLEKGISDTLDNLGHETRTKLMNSGLSFQADPYGNPIMVNAQGKQVTKTNDPNLNAALDALKSRFIDKSGEGRVSRDFAGHDVRNDINYINARIKAARVSEEDKDLKTDYSFVPQPKEKEPSTTGEIISNDSTLTPSEYSDMGYHGSIAEIKRLQTQPSRSAAEQDKLDSLSELKDVADSKLKKDPGYAKIYNEYAKADKAFKDYAKQMGSFDESGKFQRDPKKAAGKFVEVQLANLNNKRAELLKAKQDYQNDVYNKTSSLRHDLSYVPLTPKEESAWNLHNENVHSVLKGMSNIGNALDLTGIQTTGGMTKNVNDTDVANVQDLLKHGDPKTFKINNIKTFGDNKTPEITMTFNTGEDAPEYDIAGETKWSDEYGGGKQPVTVKFKLKPLSNAAISGSAPGYGNLSGLIADFYKNKGGVNEMTGNQKGAEVHNAVLENAYSKFSNEQLKQMAQRDHYAREAFMIRVARHKAKQ